MASTDLSIFLRMPMRASMDAAPAIDGVTEIAAREALRLAAMKLPIKTRTVVREDW